MLLDSIYNGDTWHRHEKLICEEGHVTVLIAREAVRWIGTRKDRPFLLYVPFTAVHFPVKEPWWGCGMDVELEVGEPRDSGIVL